MFRTLQQLFRVAFALLIIPVLFACCDMFFGGDREDAETSAATESVGAETVESGKSKGDARDSSGTEDADAEVIRMFGDLVEAWNTNPPSPSVSPSPSPAGSESPAKPH